MGGRVAEPGTMTAGETPGQCPHGLVHLLPPAALHVWVLDVPGGPFAEEMDPSFLAARLGPDRRR
jgi:hypothetical protein